MNQVRNKLEIIKPLKGSQTYFVQSPAFETLYDGTRGPGKTYGLGLSFLQGVNQGYGKDWTGILFRRKYKELHEARKLLNDLFFKLFGKALVFKSSTDTFILPDGESLKLAHIQYERDYFNFHGHAYTWLAFDELVSWPTNVIYEKLKTICRTTNKNIKTKIVSTTNSLGPGHSWVKDYFKIDTVPRGTFIKNEFGLNRVCIFGSILENKYILKDKNYMRLLLNQKDENTKKSWLFGSWDIVSGGVLSDIWNASVHVIKPFVLPISWKIYRSLDWGSSKPYCVLYYTISDGQDLVIHQKRVNTKVGDIFVIREIYGQTDTPNVGTKETPKEVKKRMMIVENYYNRTGTNVLPGPADSSIFSKDRGELESSIHDLFEPLIFNPSSKGPGSRIIGLELLREYLRGAIPDKYGYRDNRGIFFVDDCPNTIRTLPILQRSEKNPEDADTQGEDHAYDTIRYILIDCVENKSVITNF